MTVLHANWTLLIGGGRDDVARRSRDAFAAWAGAAMHRIAASMRRSALKSAEVDSANIAVVCSAFVRYASGQAIGLKQAGLNVTLYYVDRLGEFADSEEDRAGFLDRVEAAGVELVRVPRRNPRTLFRDVIWLYRDMRRRKVSLAVVQSHHDPRYAILGLFLPVALIVHDPQTHTGDALSTFPAPIRLIARVSEITASCLLVHSARLFEQIKPLLRRLPLGVIPLGAEMAARPADVPRERRLLIFGRLFEYKGVDTALEAFGSLIAEMTDATLVIAGNGPLAEPARGYRNVEVREGYVAESEVDNLLDSARLVLLPYKDATQSAVGVQAVARGVPCIVSNTGGLPDLVQDASASLVVPPNDPKRLAEAIKMHIDHGEDLREAIYSHAANNLAWPVAARDLLSELQRFGLRAGIAHQ